MNPVYFNSETICDAYRNTDAVLCQTSGYANNVNCSDVFSKMIADTGRFAERYASDILYDIDTIKDILLRMPNGDASYIVPMGIRDSGVDGITFLLQRLKETRRTLDDYVYPDIKYRRILAVEIKSRTTHDGTDVPYVTLTLKNITHNLYKWNDKDNDYFERKEAAHACH